MPAVLNRMRYETWVRKFEPINNHLSSLAAIDGTVFSKTDDEWYFVKGQNAENVWSFIVDDNARKPVWLITNGIHVVNVMGYIVTRRPAAIDVDYEIIY